jgi:hypothetical protein
MATGPDGVEVEIRGYRNSRSVGRLLLSGGQGRLQPAQTRQPRVSAARLWARNHVHGVELRPRLAFCGRQLGQSVRERPYRLVNRLGPLDCLGHERYQFGGDVRPDPEQVLAVRRRTSHTIHHNDRERWPGPRAHRTFARNEIGSSGWFRVANAMRACSSIPEGHATHRGFAGTKLICYQS